VEHYVFPATGPGGHGGHIKINPLWPHPAPRNQETTHVPPAPKRVLITGGASCPDGVIQQVIARINSLFPPESIRSIQTVQAEIGHPTAM